MADLHTDLTAVTEGSRDLSDRVLWTLGRLRSHRTPDPDRPDPTVNLQDAVDLVPADIHWQASEDGASVFWGKTEGHCYRDKKPPALALCIALLKYMEKT